MQIEIKVDLRQVKEKIANLSELLKNKKGILRSVGEEIRESVRDRIRSGGPAPDGTPWQPLSPSYLLVKKGKGILMESNQLIEQLSLELTEDSVTIGSNKVYARIHQLGGVIKHKPHTREIRLRTVKGKTRFAKKSHKNARSVLANLPTRTTTIPARPYLGVSPADEATIKKIVESQIENALK